MRKFIALGAGVVAAATLALAAPAQADIIDDVCATVPADVANLIGAYNAALATHAAAANTEAEAEAEMYSALNDWVGSVADVLQGVLDELPTGDLDILGQTADLRMNDTVSAIVAWSQAQTQLDAAEKALESAEFAVALGQQVQSQICTLVPSV